MQPTTTGQNRTGAATAVEGVRAMLDANARWAPPDPIDTTLAEADRGIYIIESDALGSVPPPVTIQGMLQSGLDKLSGERPEMLMDKIGERIAFERTGARLLVDETYGDLTHGPRLPLAAELSERAISVASMSKAYGLPGLRVGWAITRDRALQEELLAAKEQIVICGPTIDEAPQTPENRPCMRARCSSVNKSPTMMKASGSRPPAPSPCTARKAISCSMLWAWPHSSDPSRKKPMAIA